MSLAGNVDHWIEGSMK